MMSLSAMMTGISEAWEIMNTHMSMEYDDIGKVFEKWCSEGELVSVTLLRRRDAQDLLRLIEKHISRQNRSRDMREG